MKKLDKNDLRVSQDLPQGFDERFMLKLENTISQKQSVMTAQTSIGFLESVKTALFPMVFALSLCFLIYNQSKAPFSLERQLNTITQDLEIDDLTDEQWSLLLQVAEN